MWSDTRCSGETASAYEELINALGNLTLSACNPEPSDASSAEKMTHLKVGIERGYPAISKNLYDLDVWDEGAVHACTERLAKPPSKFGNFWS